MIKQLIFTCLKILYEFKSKSKIKIDEFCKRLGAYPDLKNVLCIEDINWLIPSSKVVSFMLKAGYESEMDFDMLKRLIASSEKKE
jgi:hypothetical protein